MASQQQKSFRRALLCVVLSVLLHVLLGILLLLIPPVEQVKRPAAAARKSRPVQVVRTAARKEAAKPQPKAENKEAEKEKARQEEKPFAKTSADTPQLRPRQPEYEGKRDSRASSAPDARELSSPAPAPAMHGEKKEELVTFDQERQDGDLKHEGRKQEAQPPAPPMPETAADAATITPPAEGVETGAATPDASGQDTQESATEASNSLTLSNEQSGLLKLQNQETQQPIQEREQHAARKGARNGSGDAPRQAVPRRRPVFYDPSLAEQIQAPGFRTYERRSRSNGQFVLGRGAALNVAATPRGQYEALIYRNVAHFWYIACDEHRGDIIPGKIIISLRVNRRGQIDSMALIKRSGASISQQSFTFKAIRKAPLPPMPPEVQADVIGELMELIFEFNFD